MCCGLSRDSQRPRGPLTGRGCLLWKQKFMRMGLTPHAEFGLFAQTLRLRLFLDKHEHHWEVLGEKALGQF